jgi:hypothetical protein
MRQSQAQSLSRGGAYVPQSGGWRAQPPVQSPQ